MARPGTGWEIPIINEYQTTSEEITDRNTKERITENIYGRKIRGRPVRVIAQLIQLKIHDDFKKKKLIFGSHNLSIIRLFEQLNVILRKWRDRGYSTDREADNGEV